MKQQSIKLIFGCLSLFLVSCVHTHLEPGAENVIIADGSHLPDCKALGHIYTFDTNGSTVAYTSHQNLQTNQMNILKNKTFNLGGNVLVITKHQTTYISKSKNALVDTHRIEGDAYFCPQRLLTKPMDPKAISDVKGTE